MKPIIVAECASAHGGMWTALQKQIHMAADHGCDVAKVQLYDSNDLSPDDPQLTWLGQAQLTEEMAHKAVVECEHEGIRFGASVFNPWWVPWMAVYAPNALLKIGSGEAMRPEIIEAATRWPGELVISTGLLSEVQLSELLDVLQGKPVVFLHTVSEYPTPDDHARLNRMLWLREFTGLPVGYSDHTEGTVAACAALAMGADLVEVHIPSVRAKSWDKDGDELDVIVDTARRVRAMQGWDGNDPGPSPYIGRWTHARG